MKRNEVEKYELKGWEGQDWEGLLLQTRIFPNCPKNSQISFFNVKMNASKIVRNNQKYCSIKH